MDGEGKFFTIITLHESLIPNFGCNRGEDNDFNLFSHWIWCCHVKNTKIYLWREWHGLRPPWEMITNTTPLTSFIDGLMSSVQAMKSVGKIITDGLTDRTRPSIYQSPVKPISVANYVTNKKTPTDGTPTVLQTDTRAPNFFFPREHYRRNKSVCIFNDKYRRTYRRIFRR